MTENMESVLEQLLDEVFAICKHHRDVTVASGGLFNIFSVLGIESAEWAHSRFLAELLNPQGAHGLGDAFLKLFLQRNEIEGFDSKSARVQVEAYIGPISRDKTEGGRIDILLSSAGKTIVLENKIYAEHQENQLLRYLNYAKKFQKRTWLFYLTLNGDKPPSESIGNLEEHAYHCLSYRRDIVGWLEACKKEAVNYPVLRETISQYINLIKELTNQSRNDKMNEEIASAVLKNPDRFTAFFDLQRAWGTVLDKVFKKLESELREVAARHDLTLDFDLSTECYTGFTLSKPAMGERGIQICFSFEAGDNRNLIFGFKYLDPNNKKTAPPNLLTEFARVFGQGRTSGHWPCYTPWWERRNWTCETYKEIYFGDGKLKKEIEEKVEQLLAVFEAARE